MDPEAFGVQYKQERGFFVSWHELTSGYPTLSQRTYNVLMMDQFPQPVGEPRHPLAYLFAFFSAGGRHGSGGNLLVTIAVVAMLMGIALPAFTAARQKALEARQIQRMHTTAPSFVPGGPVMKTVSFSSDVDAEGKAADTLTQVPTTLQTLYAVVGWQLSPGLHEVEIELADGTGKTLKMTHYKFTAQQSAWRTWFKIDLSGVNPRPAELRVTIYLDYRQMGMETLPVSGPL
jgi:hypothetical protein